MRDELNSVERAAETAAEEFELGEPVLVCRWRMASRHVPMLNRHIRALSQRRIQGEPLTKNLISWAKQHIEWALAEDASVDPDGVLMVVVDEQGRAAMSVGAYEPLPDCSASALCARPRRSSRRSTPPRAKRSRRSATGGCTWKSTYTRKHIEVQLRCDDQGNVVCLGERECSIQRNNQKLIEESPSPGVSKEKRRELFAAATKAAKPSATSTPAPSSS